MQPSETTFRLYGDGVPGGTPSSVQEREIYDPSMESRIAFNVTDPTLTVIAPDPSLANGTAMVVCPGGAFHMLVIDHEGYHVARWLAAHGITSFILKYRLAECKTEDPRMEWRAKPREEFEKTVGIVVKQAHADGSAAMTYVRQNADQYGIDPNRIGIIGFSAGGTVAASVAMTYTPETRPDFAAPIYLGYNAVVQNGVPADAPPLFVSAATDDELVPVSNSIRIYNDWVAAGRSAEMHLYAGGEHGFAMRVRNLPCDSWTDRFTEWLEQQGMLPK